jgi:AcrR family transcriptional regulator
MARDAEATKQRILEAAISEFAARGAAGARIDRIAGAASANKQLIYAYFGSKQELFDAAVVDQLMRLHRDVPFDPERLPEFAVAVYDFFVAHPQLARLGVWHALEEGQQDHPIPEIAQHWRQRVRAIARAQREGSLNAAIGASDLLVLLFAIARGWIVTTPEAREFGRSGIKQRRESLYEAAKRLVDGAEKSSPRNDTG